mmetsp:Transcript_19940/g.66425  ORF Transcript_19940/g.66425 Transcript_19940/m.66425 type:complete len:106 (-) Transcript_19940:852-1169(-)
MPSIEEDSAARPGGTSCLPGFIQPSWSFSFSVGAGKQKPNAKERSGGFGLALTVAGAQADGGNAHDNLKDVYEQVACLLLRHSCLLVFLALPPSTSSLTSSLLLC